MPLKGYSFFHLNLAYSAISEERREEVIERCYWPLLKLARKLNLPLGIEASAWTLETIRDIDPSWIKELRGLVSSGPCEFIGSGYCQIIGPLVPSEVNEKNLELGLSCYEDLLGLKPEIALVNEQAFSAGLVQLYLDAGFRAIIMEWNNPAKAHPEWDPEWRYLPHLAQGVCGAEIPVIWNESISFQKVQRFMHGEIALDEYLAFLRSHQAEGCRAFPIYGNDVEVFDFRPGRYMTESPLSSESEWSRFERMYAALIDEPKLTMVPPSSVLNLMSLEGAGQRLQLGTAAFPVPVKKQDKYNIVRWGVSGRDDVQINTTCQRLLRSLNRSSDTSETSWRELCYLWSSDFRTHLTEDRWRTYLARLHTAETALTESPEDEEMPLARRITPTQRAGFRVEQKGRLLSVRGDRLEVHLNCARGLAIHQFIDKQVSNRSLFGTVPHGYFDDIRWSADFYTGNLVFEAPGKPKVTDLVPVEPQATVRGSSAEISATIKTPLGPVRKRWIINDVEGTCSLSFVFEWPAKEHGCLRLGHISLDPETLDTASSFFACHNGGRELETFPLTREDFNHGDPVSFLVSANQALGITEGKLILGDANIHVSAAVDLCRSAAVALVAKHSIGTKNFFRSTFSLGELDDTSRGTPPFNREFFVQLSARAIAIDPSSSPSLGNK